ncbi:MAG TPA: hypothetical protein VGL34_15290 [Steroidobacteraceae bacterium]
MGRWAALTRYIEDGDLPIGRLDDWRGKYALQGVAVGRRRRCLSLRRISRFQSPLVEPDKQISRIKWARAHLMRNVANSKMWRSSRKPLLLQ